MVPAIASRFEHLGFLGIQIGEIIPGVRFESGRQTGGRGIVMQYCLNFKPSQGLNAAIQRTCSVPSLACIRVFLPDT